MPFGFIAPGGRPPAPLFDRADYERQRSFFAARPELTPTPLRRLRSLARELGLGELLVKDETARFGLNAFKAAGAMFAVRTLASRGSEDPRYARSAIRPGETLVCASEGNHGRAVARAARDAGCHARVYLGESVKPSRAHAIEEEGAEVCRVAGTYDDAVRVMTADAAAHGWRVISDTTMPGDDDEVPRLIMLGYTRLMDEAAAAWSPGPPPDAIFVPGGVGGLLGAVASWNMSMGSDPTRRSRIVCVEPVSAACLQVSARAGRPTSLHGPFDTEMGGLRCGEVSRAAFGAVRSGVEAYVAIEDRWALGAMARLAQPSGGDPAVRAGASGAAALAGLTAVCRHPALSEVKQHLQLGPGSRILVIVSEGVTDPDLFAQVASRPTSEQIEPEKREP